jgi:hypothetical protein
MALAVYFNPEGMDSAKYDEVIKRLEAAGQGTPAGRIHHSSFGPKERLMVYDVWESQESFDAFGAVLIPILTELGIDVGTPDVMEAHNIIQ